MNRKIPINAFVLVLFQLIIGTAWAQSIEVTGRVTSQATGEPLSGATVLIKGTTTATSTDDNGYFKINTPGPNSFIVISFIGMRSQEIAVPSNGTVNVQLTSSTDNLQEVVVVGYGTQKKSNVTGAISSVKASDLKDIPNGRIEQALQGRVAGVTIMQNSGQPGSPSTIRVRGITTFNNNNPLWVVDGVVVDAGGIGYLNQSDIASIEVLKDAASAAIYGTRAAAGVILVTTKKGARGKLTTNFNGYYGTSSPERVLKLLNATEYAVLRNESSVAAGNGIPFPDVTGLGKGTDWQRQFSMMPPKGILQN